MAGIREFPRYKVIQHVKMKGFLEGLNAPLRLLTFGGGGCGFCSAVPIIELAPPKRVLCVFWMNDIVSGPIKVQGNLLYAQNIEIEATPMYLYGIEFIKTYRPAVDPIVVNLKKLNLAGEIQFA